MSDPLFIHRKLDNIITNTLDLIKNGYFNYIPLDNIKSLLQQIENSNNERDFHINRLYKRVQIYNPQNISKPQLQSDFKILSIRLLEEIDKILDKDVIYYEREDNTYEEGSYCHRCNESPCMCSDNGW